VGALYIVIVALARNGKSQSKSDFISIAGKPPGGAAFLETKSALQVFSDYY
jgi:hypothetical protein